MTLSLFLHSKYGDNQPTLVKVRSTRPLSDMHEPHGKVPGQLSNMSRAHPRAKQLFKQIASKKNPKREILWEIKGHTPANLLRVHACCVAPARPQWGSLPAVCMMQISFPPPNPQKKTPKTRGRGGKKINKCTIVHRALRPRAPRARSRASRAGGAGWGGASQRVGVA